MPALYPMALSSSTGMQTNTPFEHLSDDPTVTAQKCQHEECTPSSLLRSATMLTRKICNRPRTQSEWMIVNVIDRLHNVDTKLLVISVPACRNELLKRLELRCGARVRQLYQD